MKENAYRKYNVLNEKECASRTLQVLNEEKCASQTLRTRIANANMKLCVRDHTSF